MCPAIYGHIYSRLTSCCPLPCSSPWREGAPGATNALAYSIDRNWAIRDSRYDVGTFHVVPLVWQSTAGLDQDKVFTVVYTRARSMADQNIQSL